MARMGRIALGLVLLVAAAGSAHAEDPNRWQGWVTPKDGQDNGIDVSMATGPAGACTKPFIALQPRYRNRYQEHVAGKLKIDSEAPDGARSALTDYDLQPGESKIIAGAQFCHDSRKSLAFSISEFHFPEREAEQAKIAAQKAAAEKAAADAAAARKAAAEKAAADTAAAEAAKREEAKRDAERRAREGEEARKREELEMSAHQREVQASRDKQAAATEYQQRRMAESQHEADGTVPNNELAANALRRGEISIAVPLGFQSADYSSNSEGRFAYGLRAELRVFAWVKRTSGPGEPPKGNGFEVAVAGGFGSTLDLREQGSTSKTNVAGGSLRGRFWLGSFGLGVFGEWTRLAHSIDGTSQGTNNLFAVGPELAMGIVASKAISIEGSVRAGAVAAGNGLAFSTGDDMFVGASVVAEINKFYGGAYATRYVTSSTEIASAWNAMGMIGVRYPF
jgi:hypothetical protein